MTRRTPPAARAVNEDVSGSISALGIWAGAEQQSFQAVIDKFNETYPNVTVDYRTAGDNLPTVLGTAVQGGNPPDVAFIAQPATIQEFATRARPSRSTSPRTPRSRTSARRSSTRRPFDGKLYGILFKAANKSLGWYNTQVFEDAGVEPPATYEDLATVASTIKASGVTPYSVAGADGWTLTDLFENIYLRTAGAGDVRPARAPRDPVDRSHRVDALDKMKTVIGKATTSPVGRGGRCRSAQPAGGAADVHRPARRRRCTSRATSSRRTSTTRRAPSRRLRRVHLPLGRRLRAGGGGRRRLRRALQGHARRAGVHAPS